MNKKKGLAIALLLLAGMAGAKAQNVKVESGIEFSNMNFHETIHPFYLMIGMDYLDKNWFNLSSNIGIIRHGGKSYMSFSDESGNLIYGEKYSLSGVYLSMNTLFNAKVTSIDKYIFYAGAGPRLDIRVGDNSFDADKTLGEFKPSFCPVLFGLRCELGIKRKITENAEIGVVGAYLPTFTHLFKRTSTFHPRSFSVGLTLGYTFDRSKEQQKLSRKRAW